MLHAVRIFPLSQDLTSKSSFDRDFEIKEVFIIVSAEWCCGLRVVHF